METWKQAFEMTQLHRIKSLFIETNIVSCIILFMFHWEKEKTCQFNHDMPLIVKYIPIAEMLEGKENAYLSIDEPG